MSALYGKVRNPRNTAGINCKRLIKTPPSEQEVVNTLFKTLMKEGEEGKAFDLIMECNCMKYKRKVEICDSCFKAFQ